MRDDIISLLAFVLRSEVSDLSASIRKERNARTYVAGSSLVQFLRSPGIKSLTPIVSCLRSNADSTDNNIKSSTSTDIDAFASLDIAEPDNRRTFVEADIDVLLQIMDSSILPYTLTIFRADARIAKRLTRLIQNGWRVVWMPSSEACNNRAVERYVCAIVGDIREVPE